MQSVMLSLAETGLGGVCMWTGAAGDGKWSSESNWDAVPVAGDTIILAAANCPEGADGVPEIEVDVVDFRTGKLQIPEGAPSFRLKGNRLNLGGYVEPHAVSADLAYDAASFACAAAGAKVEIATDIHLVGRRGFYLGDGTDVTFSGVFTEDSPHSAYVYKQGAASSRFALTGRIDYAGYVDEKNGFTNVVFHARGGTNAFPVAALGPAGAEFRISGVSGSAFAFGEGRGAANVQLRETDPFGRYSCSFAGNCTLDGTFTVAAQMSRLALSADGETVFGGAFRMLRYIGTLGLFGENSGFAFSHGIEARTVETLLVRLNGGGVAFDGPVTGVQSVRDDVSGTVDSGAVNPATILIGGRLDAPKSIILRWANVVCGVADAFNPNTELTWGWSTSSDRRSVYDLNGCDQTIRSFGVNAAGNLNDLRFIRSAKPATLTVCPTNDIVIGKAVRMTGALTFRYAPAEAVSYELTNFVSTATGDLIVQNGTLRMSGDRSTCAAVASIHVAENATLEMCSTLQGGGALKKVKSIRVASGGSFRVGPDATDPFAGSDALRMDVASDATVVLPGSLRVALLRVDGSRLPAGRYQAKDGTDATAERLPWLSGGAVIDVDVGYVWKHSVASGSWMDAANWDGGVPTASGTAFVLNEGRDYDIRVTDATEFGDILIRNDGTHTSRISISNGCVLASASGVAIERGGRLEVGAGGGLAFFQRDSLGSNGIKVREGGQFTISGDGSASVFVEAGRWVNPLEMDGGLISVRDDGRLRICGSAVNCRYFGTGATTFSDSARLVVSCKVNEHPVVFLSPNGTGETLEMNFTGASGIEMGDDGMLDGLVLGHKKRDSLSIMRRSGTGVCDLGRSLHIGWTLGSAALYVSGGTVRTNPAGGYGIKVGSANSDDGNGAPDVVGRMEVSGGTVEVNTVPWAFDGVNALRGLCVGADLRQGAAAAGRVEGHVVQSGGLITNVTGCVTIGAGRAEGRFVQTGGAFGSSSAYARAAMLIGFLGGTGEYVMSNGVATVGTDVYVGGVLTNRVGFCPGVEYPGGHDAVGRLEVVSGTFSTEKDIVLSADGAGTLEIGHAGRVLASNVVLSNGTFSAKTSTVRFVFGADGVGRVEASGRMDIAPGSRMEVDLSGYRGEPKCFALIRCTSRAGSFADADIAVSGWDHPQYPISVRQSDTGVRLAMSHGMVLVVR